MKFKKYPNSLMVMDVKAVKRHRCDICGGTIEPKEVYTHIKNPLQKGHRYQHVVEVKACLHHDVNKMRLHYKTSKSVKEYRDLVITMENDE
jgi:hypothetical protein